MCTDAKLIREKKGRCGFWFANQSNLHSSSQIVDNLLDMPICMSGQCMVLFDRTRYWLVGLSQHTMKLLACATCISKEICT